ncbi:Disease resistance protein RPM1 [Hordeum vulgare]|nr:Disease resistance protein RPM1 [Hordeum vulgare]
MTVTLQDVSMITALLIEGKPLCMSTDSEGWRHQMDALIGMSPPEPKVEDGGKKGRVPAGASFTWIAANFAHCPEDANDEVIQTYARVYMWYVISRTIFADDTGKNAPWMWLKALTVFDNKFSWGSAALAYLYRQLDDACRRSTKDDGVGGCMLLLSFGNAFLLDALKPQRGRPGRTTATLYGFLPGLTSWIGGGSERSRIGRSIIRTMSSCSSKVCRQLRESARVEIFPSAYEEDILEEPTKYDALAHGEYNKLIREGYQTSFAPVLNFVHKEVKKQTNETEAILGKTPEGKKEESALRLFIKGKKLWCLSNILGCRDPEYVSPSRSGSSQRNTLDDSTSSGARMGDGDITSASHLEDDVDTPEVEDEMTLKAFQRSAYTLKPRKEFKRYSPDDYAHKGKNPVAGGSRLSMMRSMDDGDELDEPEPLVRRKKLASKRGRGPKM